MLLRTVLLRTTRRADRLANAPTPEASAISSCQATRASIWPALFIAATYVTVLNKQVRQCSMARLLQLLLRFRPRDALPAVTALRMERRRNFFHRVQSWHHTWYITTGASQLDPPHACCTVTVAVLGGLVCAQSRSAFARDGSSERVHNSRRRW